MQAEINEEAAVEKESNDGSSTYCGAIATGCIEGQPFLEADLFVNLLHDHTMPNQDRDISFWHRPTSLDIGLNTY